MSRISQTFDRLGREKARGLIIYLTAGDPHPGRTVDLILGLEKGGADIIELAFPSPTRSPMARSSNERVNALWPPARRSKPSCAS